MTEFPFRDPDTPHDPPEQRSLLWRPEEPAPPEVDEQAEETQPAADATDDDSSDDDTGEIADTDAPADTDNEAGTGEIAESEATAEPPSDAAAEPQFGLLDIVEAFTALRHEYRTNTRENRQLTELVQSAVRRLDDLSRKISQAAAAASEADSDRPAQDRLWVDTLVEIDLSLTRAVEATERSIGRMGVGDEAADDWQTLEQEVTASFDALGPLRRWTTRRFFEDVRETIREKADAARTRPVESPTAEGLRMVVRRVRHLLHEHQIERVDTLGAPFDAESMNAVEAIDTAAQPPGTVLRQLNPAYRWRGKLIRYAEVCVTQSP